MLEQKLREIIPSELSEFKKITEGGDPYYFESWDQKAGNVILRYWFWNKENKEKQEVCICMGSKRTYAIFHKP